MYDQCLIVYNECLIVYTRRPTAVKTTVLTRVYVTTFLTTVITLVPQPLVITQVILHLEKNPETAPCAVAYSSPISGCGGV